MKTVCHRFQKYIVMNQMEKSDWEGEKMREAYLDNAATTQVDREVAQLAFEVMTQQYGNPSSLHKKGIEAQLLLDQARARIGAALGCPADRIFFTSGGTESNNLAVLGAAQAKKRRGNRIVTTAVEHSSVLDSAKHLQNQGWDVVFLKPEDGRYSPEQFAAAVDENTVLVSFMLINNENGLMLPAAEIIKAVRRKKPDVMIHCDGVQAFGKHPVSVAKLDVDLLSFSGHKIHAPKGVGGLYIKKGVRILPRSFGGSQEGGIRTGTESVPLICALGLAAERASQNIKNNLMFVSQLHDIIFKNVVKLQGVCINSPQDATPYIMNLSPIGYRSEVMLHYLEDKGVYLSSGSACSKGAKSHVLAAMGYGPGRIDSALRVSLSPHNTPEDISQFVQALTQGMAEIRKSR